MTQPNPKVDVCEVYTVPQRRPKVRFYEELRAGRKIVLTNNASPVVEPFLQTAQLHLVQHVQVVVVVDVVVVVVVLVVVVVVVFTAVIVVAVVIIVTSL